MLFNKNELYKRVRARTHICTHPRTDTHAYTHSRTRPRTHANTHTNPISANLIMLFCAVCDLRLTSEILRKVDEYSQNIYSQLEVKFWLSSSCIRTAFWCIILVTFMSCQPWNLHIPMSSLIIVISPLGTLGVNSNLIY